jgi:peptidoglycan/LPS O-acetylase OafA/YrhL
MKNSQGRLTDIDALRGVAAVAVVLVHVFEIGVFNPREFPFKGFANAQELINHILLLPVSFGWTGVYLFFVISGFCIHLRWVKSQLQGKPGTIDFAAFWKRRIVRLYPAYIAALACYIGYAYKTTGIDFNAFFAWDLISHLLMIHNLDPRTAYTMNNVFWTLAIEEQLYLLYFPLLWLRKKYGWLKTLAVCASARIAWFGFSFLILRQTGVKIPVSESSLSNWVIWALGAVSVEATFGLIKLPRFCYSGILMAAFFGAASVSYYLDWLIWESNRGQFHNFVIVLGQPLWGATFFILVNKVVRAGQNRRGTIQTAISGAKDKTIATLAYLGLFSYSLYLMHLFVITFIPGMHWSVKTIASIVFARLFFEAFEKPFIPKPSR